MSTKRVRDENDAEIAKLVKRRKYYIIPNDQQKILDKGNFYPTLKNQPDGLRGNIPPAVIEGLMAQYRRNELAKLSSARIAAYGSQTPGRGSPARSDSVYRTPRQNTEDAVVNTKDLAASRSRASTDRNNHREGSQSTNPQNLQSPSLSSSPGRPMSWEPSPTYHRYRQDTAQPTEPVEEPRSPSQTASRVVQVPSGAASRVQIDYDNIPSSDGVEEDLEVNIPDAQELRELSKPIINISSTRRGLLRSSPLKETLIVQNTPPCAQPDPAVIPNTLDQKPRGLDNGGQRKGRKAKWLPIPSLSDEVTLEQSAHNKVRMPTTRIFDMDSSNATESSMIVPATLEPIQGGLEDARLEHLLTPEAIRHTVRPGLSPPGSAEVAECSIPHKLMGSNAQPAGHGSGPHDQKGNALRPRSSDGQDRTLEHRQGAELSFSTGLYSQGPLTQDNRQPPVSSLAASQHHVSGTLLPGRCALRMDVDPYTHFKSVYPSYEGEHGGSSTRFIQAAVILESPRSRVSIKSMLFDDFVRQFAGGYTAYVHETGPDRESQPALEWFNWRDEPSVFTSGVLDRKNIDLIRKAYPLAFEEVKKLPIGDTPNLQMSHQPSEEIRETIEVDIIDEGDDSGEFELGEPDRPKQVMADGAYPPPKSGSFTAIDSKREDQVISDEKQYVPQRLFRSPDQPQGRRSPLTELGDTASQDKVSRRGEERTSTGAPTAQVLPGGTHEASPLAGLGAAERRTQNMANSELPSVSPAAGSAASVSSAGPSSVTGSGKKPSSTFMRPLRPLSEVAKPGSHAPASSSMPSTCKVSSSAGFRKPGGGGMAYLQRLKLKGSSDEARDARMRELGRAKRMSSGGSVTSSHAS